MRCCSASIDCTPTRVATGLISAVKSTIGQLSNKTAKPKTRRKRKEPAWRPEAMVLPALKVADIFRDHGAAWRRVNAGHISLGQLKVMSAVERCRTAALGGHVARCENGVCGHTVISFNSCRNRHCPKCQGSPSRTAG